MCQKPVTLQILSTPKKRFGYQKRLFDSCSENNYEQDLKDLILRCMFFT